MKGALYVYFVILVVLFTLTFLYNIFSFPWVTTYTNMYEMINDTVANETIKSDAMQTMSYVNNVWTYWPIVLIFFLLLWGFVASQRKEPVDYYA